MTDWQWYLINGMVRNWNGNWVHWKYHSEWADDGFGNLILVTNGDI